MSNLFTADTHTTQQGTTFYSSWMATGDEQAKYEANQQAFKEYTGRYQYVSPKYQPTGDEKKLLLAFLKENEYRHSARIIANPEHLTPAEVALIFDEGNLCFGYQCDNTNPGNVVTAYLD